MLMRYRNCGHCLPAAGLSLDYIIYTLCALIQHERNLIIEMDTPNALRDLFVEQSKIDARIKLDKVLTKLKCTSSIQLNVLIISISPFFGACSVAVRNERIFVVY